MKPAALLALARPSWSAAALMLLGALISACASGPATLDAALLAAAGAGTLEVLGTRAAAQETLTATALWPTDTATPTRTATASATATPTPTATVTPTPLPSGAVVAAGTLRTGPGQVYPAMASLLGGETARPLGQTEAGDWLLIELEAGAEGWLPRENFALDNEAVELPVITDLPPTPTRPPATLTPTLPPPTATRTPSPWTCELSITWDPGGKHVILIGQNWPPNSPATLSVTTTFAGRTSTNTWPNWFGTGDADDQIPNGFWYKHQGGHATYTVSTWACSTTVTGP